MRQKTRPLSKNQKKRTRHPARDAGCGMLWESKEIKENRAAITIQRHFRGMIVRNPMDIPIDKWLSLVVGPIEKDDIIEKPVEERECSVTHRMDRQE